MEMNPAAASHQATPLKASSSFHDVTSLQHYPTSGAGIGSSSSTGGSSSSTGGSSSSSSVNAPTQASASTSLSASSAAANPRGVTTHGVASSSRLARAPSMPMDRSRSSTLAQTAALAAQRDRSNSWAVSSSLRTYFPGNSHVIDAHASGKLQREMDRAVKVVRTFLSPKLLKDQSIPRELLVEAYGLVFLTVYKVGFLFSGKVGNGFIISRTTSGWSAPSFISSGGLGFGMMAGGEVVNYMIVLNSRSAVKVFTRNGQFQLGSELDLAVGPIGRAASAAVNVGRGGFAPNYSYSHSKGLYGGIGLTSAVICTRKSLNAKCYGSAVTARQILGGEVPCTLAVPLWQALDAILGVRREYVDGFPVVQPAATGVGCEICGHVNSTEAQACAQCQNLLVYSVSVHSGRRNAGGLVVSDHSASAMDVAASSSTMHSSLSSAV